MYANDTACDVRDTWLKKLREGAPGEAATAELLHEWGSPDDDPLFWLALADTQWSWGRLETHVATAPSARSRPAPISRCGSNRRIVQLGSASSIDSPRV